MHYSRGKGGIMHLYYYHYSKKFNILHSFDDNVHLHTVEAELIFLDESQDFDKFGDMEQKLAQYFQYFDNQYLNELKEFKDTVPTIENLGYVLFENLKILMSSTNYKLVKLNIGENPSRKYTITDFLVTGNITKDSLPDDLRTEEYITEHYAEVLKKYNAKKAQMKLEQEKYSLAEQGKQNNQSESDNAQGKALQEMSQDSDTPDLEEVLLDGKNVQSYEFERWNEPPKPITLRSRIIALYGFVYTTIISALFGLYLFTIHSIPNGDEIYLHLGKAKYLYNEIVNKQFSPIYMLNWFNGYLMFVKSPPLPYYLLALCQWITGGDIVLGYYILVVFAMCIGSYGFVEFGKKCDNSFIGIIFGILWLFNPETVRVV